MDLMLTSFGVSHLPRRDRRNTDLFYRMPPAAISAVGQELMPDYATLLIADRIVMDRSSYEFLLAGKHRAYGNFSLMAKMLHDEGFLRLEDYQAEVEDSRDLLEDMLARDLRELDSWVPLLKDSLDEWRTFSEGFRGSLREDFIKGRLADQGIPPEEADLYHEISYRMAAWMHSSASYSAGTHALIELALRSSRERRKSEPRAALREVISEYLAYINANLFLSQRFESGFFDWSDFRPFYQDKFSRIAKESHPGKNEIDSVKKLFEVSFPEFTFWQPDNVIRALKDKRIEDLRQLIASAAAGEVEFDREFATRALTEVLSIEQSIGKLRNFASYVTLPLGFIPIYGTPIQKAAEEVISRPIASRKKRDHRWFYLISELSTDRKANKSMESNG